MGKAANGGAKAVVQDRGRKSGAVARRGVRTIEDFGDMMLALMVDVVEGSVTPAVVNAAANVGGKALKAFEIQHKYAAQAAQRAAARPIPLGSKKD